MLSGPPKTNRGGKKIDCGQINWAGWWAEKENSIRAGHLQAIASGSDFPIHILTIKLGMEIVFASSSSFTFAGDGIKDGSASSPSSSDSNQTNPTGEQQQWTQQSNQTGRLIVKTLDGLELDQLLGDEHASAVHRLIVAAVVIALIAAILIATVLLFRCYMLFCQDYLNIRRYQRPPQLEEESTATAILLQQQQQSGYNHFRPIKVQTASNGGGKNGVGGGGIGGRQMQNSVGGSFRCVFDDDSPL